MLKEIDTVKLIFGLKVQQLRREKNLSYQQLSDLTGLAISYLHNIEKGKKYPKADKIIALSKALDADYNYLVSLKADKKLKPIVDLLHSDFLKIFPLGLFGIDTTKLIELLSHTPDKVNAFVSTVIKIIRNFDMQGEDFYKAALRSYQDLYDNYFPNIEESVRTFKQQNITQSEEILHTAQLEELLNKQYDIRVDRQILAENDNLASVRSFFEPKDRILYLNAGLDTAQENFLLAKELGFQFMDLRERPFETRMIEVDSFEKLLNNFRASYFSVALLLDEKAMVREVKRMSDWPAWDGKLFLKQFEKYNVTSEMLLQRLANIIPHHFDIKNIFFLRFYSRPDFQKFIMTKEMHLSQLHDPHANQLDEHYCRRWISISIIRRLKAEQGIENIKGPVADAQVSKYVGTPNSYLCISIAKSGSEDPETGTSVTIGLLVNKKLQQLFPFLRGDSIKTKDVHTTCERCPISDCGARAVPPVFLQQQRSRERVRELLKELKKEVSSGQAQ